ncbi:MAG: hypothetical protein J6M34_03830 [Clostridia bacterium]|nr:hypothetical protein [Clostridia bacterium]
MSNLILGNDQWNEQAVLYDLDLLQNGDPLEKGEIWSFPCGHFAGLKHRENTPFGDVILTGGTISYMVAYPSNEVLWSTDQSGNNTHSVEILPSGNIVLANSHGNDVRLFRTSALLAGDTETAKTYTSYPFFCTHGVLWDPVYECLWVLGDHHLAAWRVVGEGVDECLEPMEGKFYSLAEVGNGGHDLIPDLTDSRYLLCSPNAGVLRFNKETGVFEDHFLQEKGHYKAFSPAEDGSFVFANSDKSFRRRDLTGWYKQAWCVDHAGILRFSSDGTPEETRIYAEKAAFYKVRSFYGKYL